MPRPKKAAVLLSLLILSTILGAAFYWAKTEPRRAQERWAKRAPEAESAAKLAGLPLTQDELKGPRPADEDNAFLALTSMPELTHQDELAPVWEEISHGRVVSDESFALTQSYAASIVEAAALPEFWVATDLDYGSHTRLPHLLQVKLCGKLMQARLPVLAERGENEQFLKEAQALSQLRDHLSDQPMIVAQLVSASINDMELIAKARSYSRAEPGLRASLRQMLDRHHFRVDFEAGMKGEHYMATATLRNLHLTDDEQAPPSSLVRNGLPPDVPGRAGYARHLIDYSKVVAHGFDDAESRQRAQTALSSHSDLASWEMLDVTRLWPAGLWPQVGEYFAVEARAETQRRMALAHLRISDGAAESDLGQDAFTGAPLKIIKMGSERYIYSVGPDGIDQTEPLFRESPRKIQGGTDDLRFRAPLTASKQA